MVDKRKKELLKKKRRAHRVSSRIHGSADRPRASVFRSSKHIYVQAIDDDKGVTLFSASDKELKSKRLSGKEQANEVGKLAAAKAKEKGISQIVFDRRGYKYHGRVKELAEGMRSGGLKF